MQERDKDIYQQFNRLYNEVHKRVVGNEEAMRNVIIVIFCGENILLEGVPGVGKTLLAKTVAEALDCTFKRIQCSPDIMERDIIGSMVYDEKKKQRVLVKGPIFANIVLIDEINRLAPKLQAIFLEAMEEKTVTIEGVSYPLPQPFTVLATQNPIEQEGTTEISEAQKDRFIFKVIMGYLTPDEEMSIAKSKFSKEPVNKIFNPAEIMIVQNEINKNVYISDSVMNYIIEIVNDTRQRKEFDTGASPRATIALMKASKTFAFLDGRDYVTPNDVRQMAYPVLRHRVIFTPEAELSRMTPEKVIERILKRVEMPVD